METQKSQTNIVTTIKYLKSIYQAICDGKNKGLNDNTIKEIDVLKDQCCSENNKLSVLACQTFVRLVDDGLLDGPQILTMFIAMLPSVNSIQYTAISEGVIGLLLLDLRKNTILLKNNEEYICPYGLKPPEHPLIFLLQNKDANINDLANKINGICTHHDKEINTNSIEFLRPVFLYALCNPHFIPNSKTIWTCILSQIKKSDAEILIYDILSWRNISSPSACLFTSILLTEAIEVMLNIENRKSSINLTIYLTSILNDLINWCYDPRPTLNVILRVLYKFNKMDTTILNLLLIILAKTLHIITPIYFMDTIRLLKFIIITQNGGNYITLNMIVDGLLLWIANSFFISTEEILDAEYLIEFIVNENFIETQNKNDKLVNINELLEDNIKYVHSNIAISYDLAILSERFNEIIKCNKDNDKFQLIEQFIINLSLSSYDQFCREIQLFLRGMFLCGKLPQTIKSKIFKILLNLIRIDENIAVDLLYTVLYKLSREIDSHGQLELLQGLTCFAIVKDNVPIILSTLNALSTSALKTLSLDLYLRLWKVENRTYPFFNKLLSTFNADGKEKNGWEINITKAYTIREICKLKAEQHGTDLVTQLSNILNQCNDNRGDVATSIALDAIIILCNSHVVNITSTWKALGGKFRNEKRLRAVQSLCKFFGQVPLLRSPTMEYEQLLMDANKKLWHYCVLSDRKEIIGAALKGLKSFKLDEMTLKEIPDIFREKITLPSEYAKTPIDASRNPIDVLPYVPGDCWLQLIQKINQSAIDDAIELVSHFIYNEISGYRSGVYMLPEGRPEPLNLQQLHRKSPLRAIVSYLMNQSSSSKKKRNDKTEKSYYDNNNNSSSCVINCLKCISKKFPKPIPPLNWFFLIEFLNETDEHTILCLRIATNQLLQSGSAKNLVENYLLELKAIDRCSPDIILNLIKLLPDFSNAIETMKLKQFSEDIIGYSYNMSKGTNFEKGCLFEICLLQFKLIFEQQKCLIDDNVKMFASIFEKYLNLLDIDNKIFQIYANTACFLPSNTLDSMTSPNTWWEITTDKLKKATIIRCTLVLNNDTIENPLYWLNPIIDNVDKNTVTHTFILRQIIYVLHKFSKNDKCTSIWLMEILSEIQCLLTGGTDNYLTNEMYIKCQFMIDLFIISIDILSGCGLLYGSIDTLVESQVNRLNCFPASLYVISERDYWKNCMGRIHDFLHHHFLNSSSLPVHITKLFKNSLICSKYYIIQKSNWIKYVGLRK